MQLIDIARVCYATNREFCLVSGDPVPAPWDEITEDARQGYAKGVQYRLSNPLAPAAAQHDEWCRSKAEDGWTHGPVKDEGARQHPNLVPYQALPLSQRLKDTLFKGVVVALAPLHYAARPESERLAQNGPV